MGGCCSAEDAATSTEITRLIVTERELPLSFDARVLHVTDAQTLIVQPNNAGFTLRIMLHGISTPRIRTRNLPDKDAAIRARAYVRQKVENQIVLVKRITLSTYRVQIDGVDLAQDLLFHGLVTLPTIREMI
jgi:hypothetical protein